MTKNHTVRIDEFFAGKGMYSYRKGEYIIRAEDVPQGVYYVKKGYVRMLTILENGREITLNIFQPGSFFPMIWAIAEIPNQYYFQAMMPVATRRCAKKEILDLLEDNPELLFELTKRFLRGMDGLIEQFGSMLIGNASIRVTAALLLLARRFGEKKSGGEIRIPFPLTHYDIANLVGVTRETASIFIKKLLDKELIIHNHRIMTITDLIKLENEVDLLKDDQRKSQTL